MTEPRVGFVGLGQIGAPMARHLVDWPTGLVVCDRRREATAPFVEAGATCAATPGQVASVCDVISVMVVNDDQTNEVVAGPDGVLTTAAPGSVIAVHSTIAPETAETLGAMAAARGVELVDAPVSGGFIGAHDGTLAAMVGGTEAAVEQCRGPFARWASLIVRAGPVGAGTRLKLARNLMHFVMYAGAGEAQRLATAAGLNLGQLAAVVRHSDAVTGGASAIMVRQSAEPFDPDDAMFDLFDHARALGEKDLALAQQLAAALDVDVPFAALARQRLGFELGVRPEPA
ncbi:MAG: NAD(P)-dependent oxidoreductase [Actinobacteria bacterium]|nr:NAD(P)-dependent oxidoreductase [Actinomycetota bacterium]